ncbi:hypothetical protein GF327_09435 [Candidatus Woesearchaeota archaeon]|nr:hypothetical protein [Candidatus Woesearchaeota archaeon]
MWQKAWDEVQHVVTGMQINYTGVFNYQEIFRFIDRHFRKKGYEKMVLMDKEKVFKTGKSIHARLRPYKVKGDARLEVQIWIEIENMTEFIKEFEEKKVKLNKGDVSITIDAFVVYNQRGKWEVRAEYVFIRTLFDKFLTKPESANYEGQVKVDAVEFKQEINSLLNLYKFMF